jgi:ATP-dependent protease HslVU (ClpYQ) peptidase subunit
MTCIIGYVDKEKVYIGGDSMVSNGYDSTDVSTKSKVFKKGEFLFGIAGRSKIIQLLEFSLEIPENKYDDDYKYLCTDFISVVRECFKNNGFMEIENSIETADGSSNFLLGYRGNLYWITPDLSVIKQKYFSIGSGFHVAKGALEVLEGFPELKTRVRIIRSLKAASKLTPWVGPPFVVKSMKR